MCATYSFPLQSAEASQVTTLNWQLLEQYASGEREEFSFLMQ